MNVDAVPSQSRPRLRLARLGLWLGLVYGFLEATAVVCLSLIPGGLAWSTGNAPPIVWVAPLFYALAGLVLGLVFVGLSRLRPTWRWDDALVAVAAAGGMMLGGRLPPVAIAQWAIIILAVGAGVQIMRVFRARRLLFERFFDRSLKALLGLVAVLVVGVTVATRVAEAAGMPDAGATADRPNVLIITIDTLRGDHVSCLGYGRETTPRLDALARDGVLYEHAYASSSWTLPTHATLFTGKLPQVHGAGKMRRAFLDGRFSTLAEHFRAAGYATGGFVANGFWCGRQTRVNRGFIRYEDFYGSWQDAVVRTALGRVLASSVAPLFGATEIPGRKRASTINADYLRWLDGVSGRPSFAFLNYFDVHGPYFPDADIVGRYDTSGAGKVDHAHEFGRLDGAMPTRSATEYQSMRDRYDECIVSVDRHIGNLMDELGRRGILDRTLVVITSDHGESFGQHGLVFHGHSLYLDQIMAPLILRWPGRVPSGSRVADAVGLERVAATVEWLVEKRRSAFPGPVLPGLGAAEDGPSEPVVCGVARRSQVSSDWPTSKGWVTALLTTRWHFILQEDGRTELYDLSDDVAEEVNLADKPEHAAVIADFKRRTPGGLWK